METYDEDLRELFAPDVARRDEYRTHAAEEKETLRLAAKNLLASEDGRRVLCDLLQKAGVLESSFRAAGDGATFFLEGRRSVGLYLLGMLLDADAFALHTLIQFRLEHKGGEHV